MLSRRSIVTGLTALPLLVSAPGAGARVAPLRIGVIGSGWLGGTVGRIWVGAGHEVFFSSLHPEELEGMVRSLGRRAQAGSATEAAAFGTVLLFAVPYEALPQLGRDLAPRLAGKIALDACNPVAGANSALAREAETRGVAETSARLLSPARYVRVFSAVDATAIAASADGSGPRLGVPLASNDAEALKVAAQLVRDVRCDPVPVRDLAAARTFQRGGPAFRANATAPRLRRLLGHSAKP
jgi:predicted dinucleotide-binding enzyme